MEVVFTLEGDDRGQLYRDLRPPGRWRLFRRSPLFLPSTLVFLLFFGGLGLFFGTVLRDVDAWVWNVLYSGWMAGAIFVTLCNWFVNREARKMLPKQPDWTRGPIHAEVQPVAFRYDYPMSTGSTSWRALRILEGPGHIHFLFSDTAGMTVPRRAFDSPEQAAEFVALARHYKAEAEAAA